MTTHSFALVGCNWSPLAKRSAMPVDLSFNTGLGCEILFVRGGGDGGITLLRRQEKNNIFVARGLKEIENFNIKNRKAY